MTKITNIKGEQPLVSSTPRAKVCGAAQPVKCVTSDACEFERKNNILTHKGELCVVLANADAVNVLRKERKRKAPKFKRQHKYSSIYKAPKRASSMLVVDTTPDWRIVHR